MHQFRNALQDNFLLGNKKRCRDLQDYDVFLNFLFVAMKLCKNNTHTHTHQNKSYTIKYADINK